jgi:hypothetical protein
MLGMQFTVDYINENISIWESMKKKDLQVVETSPVEKNMVTPNSIPSPEGKNATGKRPRSGI